MVLLGWVERAEAWGVFCEVVSAVEEGSTREAVASSSQIVLQYAGWLDWGCGAWRGFQGPSQDAMSLRRWVILGLALVVSMAAVCVLAMVAWS